MQLPGSAWTRRRSQKGNQETVYLLTQNITVLEHGCDAVSHDCSVQNGLGTYPATCDDVYHDIGDKSPHTQPLEFSPFVNRSGTGCRSKR